MTPSPIKRENEDLNKLITGMGTTMDPFEMKVSKGAKIRNRYNQVPHLTQVTNGKVTNSVIHHKRESRGQPFPSR